MDLLDVLVIGAAAALGGVAARRLRQPAVLGEVAAGLLLAPSLLGDMAGLPTLGVGVDGEFLEGLAEIGAVVLLFLVGLECDIGLLRRHARSGAAVAVIGIAVSLAAGAGASLALARTWPAWPNETLLHLTVGVALAATSVGITARVLGESGRLSTPEATIILTAAVLDDVGGLLLLAVLSALAGGTGIGLDDVALRSALFFASAAATMALAPRLMRRMPEGGLLPSALAVALLLAAIAHWAGLSAIVGAFAAGLAFSQVGPRHALATQAAPLGWLLPPLFFASIGMRADFLALGDRAAAALAVGTLLAAIGIAAKLASGLGVRRGEADRLVVGVGMVPRGEVGLIVAAIALTAGILADWQYAALVVTALLTTLVAPPWLAALRGRFVPGPPPAVATSTSP